MKTAVALLQILLVARLLPAQVSAKKNLGGICGQDAQELLCSLNSKNEKSFQIPSVSSPTAKPKWLLAGSSRVDITPPPGFPTGGAGIAGGIARGYWKRLYARAFFFRDTAGQSLALVSCELFGIPDGLHAEVVRRLNTKPTGTKTPLNISRDNLILSATHTHQGPGNFLTSKVYNDHGSIIDGFDPLLFEKLVERIKDAVIQAAKDAEDSAQYETTLRLRTGTLDFLRSRAVEPFLLNYDRQDVLDDGKALPCKPDDPYPGLCPIYRSVDPLLNVLEIRRSNSTTGVLVFFGAHPEVMAPVTPLYQSDFPGLAMNTLESRAGGPSVAAFFNGADGDISAQWNERRRNRIEATEFADYLVEAIDNLPAPSPADELGAITIRVARRELLANPKGDEQRELFCADKAQLRCLAPAPQFGTATPGGAGDGRSALYPLGWTSGVRTEVLDLQKAGLGVKLPAFDSAILPVRLTDCIAPACFFQERLPVTLLRFGRIDIAALPIEMTRTMWRRVRRSLEAIDNRPMLLIGLANDYEGYVPTPQEYAAQNFEGATDLYGAYSGEVYGTVLVELKKNLHPPIPPGGTQSIPYSYNPGPGKCFGPETLGAPHADPDEALEKFIVDSDDLPKRRWPRFRWEEKGINDWDASSRQVEIREKGQTVAYETDKGRNFLTVFLNPATPQEKPMSRPEDTEFGPYRNVRIGPYELQVRTQTKSSPGASSCEDLGKKKSRNWMAFWLPPSTANQTLEYFFYVTLANGKRVCSEYFQIAKLNTAQTPQTLNEMNCP